MAPPPKTPPKPAREASPLGLNLSLALGSLRMLAGAACLAVPLFTARTFFLADDPSVVLPLRMLGGRELILATLLLSARSRRLQAKEAHAASQELLQAALWANIVADSMDALSCVAGAIGGSLSVDAALLVSPGALLFVGIGALALQGV